MDKDASPAPLTDLVVDAGGPAAFVRAYSQPAADKPIDPTYVFSPEWKTCFSRKIRQEHGAPWRLEALRETSIVSESHRPPK